ncbi:hypothetical protein [Photobacterium kasasachensis]|uniref:hypothetical protein n=1 Tax=Photobacterium kasasachensis TaxID=2910240 RepID=UPI003D1471EF
MKKSTQKTQDSAVNTAFAAFTELQQKQLSAALNEYGALLKESITRNDGQISNQTLAVKQGFVAEAAHTGSFNIEAAARGESNIRAHMVPGNDPVTDIRITSPSGPDADFQLKFYQDGEASAKSITKMRYTDGDVGKVIPSEQMDEAMVTSHQEALRNQHTRPEVSKDYQHTNENLTDSISHPDRPDIKSQTLNRKGKGGSEDLTKQVDNGELPEYSRSQEAQHELQMNQYGDALKYGALAGLLTSSATQLYGALTSNEPLTEEDYIKIAEEVIKGTVSSAGKALLTTGIQHVGKEMVKKGSHEAVKSIGKQLGKGNVAANVAILSISLGKDLHRMSQGEIDGVELAESTLNTSISLAASAGGYAAGVGAAGLLAPHMTALLGPATANFAVMGTTLGALGPIALGVVGGIAASVVVTKYCEHFSSKGTKIAISDIESSMALLSSGKIDLATYTGQIGTMSELSFSWGDMLPLSGTFSVFGEYKTRKQQLMSIQNQIQTRRANLPEREAELLYAMQANYMQQLKVIEAQFEEKKTALFEQTDVMFGELENELDSHLNQHYRMRLCKNEARLRLIKQQDKKTQAVLERQEKTQVYTDEIRRLREEITSQTEVPIELVRYMRIVLDNRMNEVLPKVTPADLAVSYFNGELSDAV